MRRCAGLRGLRRIFRVVRPEYHFVPVVRADYPLISYWLRQPHIGGWWGAPEHEIALIEKDFGQGKTDMRMVWYRGHAFAYAQDWDVGQEDAPHYAHLPRGSRGLDTFLGDPAYLGQGHAARYLRVRAQCLIAAGAPCVAVDPDPANVRAVATYKKAGFAGDLIALCQDGDPVQVMTFQGGKASGRTET
ncbi:aminoglycoside 6'-N-acetyltransferase [Monaibacterium marinum]|uniref:Aminoglycoside 6'-N-acetyltransferase n=1 Tax=Pontivivens marinum TaxID=1690039 RepID=A0A2C9CND8_9RHOB|nr:aminoglycoside 6'-N-acetyltransferase [Monaibacterium marinum]